MGKTGRLIWTLCGIGVLVVLIPCGGLTCLSIVRANLKPTVDDQGIESLAEVAASNGTQLTPCSQRKRGIVVETSGDEIRNLLLSLRPIKSGPFTEPLRHPTYELLFRGGKEATVIYVQSDGQTLRFEIWGKTYSGGDIVKFNQIAESLCQREQRRD